MVKSITKKTVSFIALLIISVSLSIALESLNNVTITSNINNISNASTGSSYLLNIVINNNNESNFFVVISAPNVVWQNSSKFIFSNSSDTFSGNYTIPSDKPSSLQIVAHIYNSTNTSQNLFNLTKTIPISYYVAPEYTFCRSGNVGNLEIRDFYIDNLGYGDDDEWQYFDKIEISVEVYNNNRDERVDDVILEIMVLDKYGNDVTKDFNFEKTEISLGRIKERDSKSAKFTIKELPVRIDEGDYKIYIKAYSKDNEDSECVSSSKEFDKRNYELISVVREEDPAVFVRYDGIQKISVTCGQKNVDVTLPVYNVGSRKEDRVLVTISNSALGIYKAQVINNLRSGKKTDVTFLIDIPENLDRSFYDLVVKTYFDVDDIDGDLYDISNYDENSDNIGRTHVVRLEVVSCKKPEFTISARLESQAKVGEELIIMATLRNPSDTSSFVISATDFEDWAELISITPEVLTIQRGEIKEVVLKLNPKESGLKSFKLVVTSSEGEKYIQPVSVNIIASDSKKATNVFKDMDSITLSLVIGIITLIILIIIVLIFKGTGRESRRRERE